MKKIFSSLFVVLLICAMLAAPVEAKGKKHRKSHRMQTQVVQVAPVVDPLAFMVTVNFEPGKPTSTRMGLNCHPDEEGHWSCW